MNKPLSAISRSIKKKGTEGAFTAKARSAGMSVPAYAKKVEGDPNVSTKTKRQGALARTFAKYRN